MPIDLYLMGASPPCCAVNLVASALGIQEKINQIKVNVMAGEQLKPEFVKLNPQHTIPTLVDDGFALWESRAICRYLVNKYGGDNNPLYPADVKTKAIVDQRLDFDLSTLNKNFGAYVIPIRHGKKPEEGLQKVHDALGMLNTFLEGNKYVAGENLTIADLCLVVTVSTIELAEISLDEYPNILRWYELVKKTAPNYQKAHEEPLKELKALIASNFQNQ